MCDTILQKTDPFLLDQTVDSLGIISPTSNPSYPLPLSATEASGDTEEDRPYLETPFNRLDGENNYRSPWKAFDNGETEILAMEQTANEVWDAYRQLYYGHDAVGSVFVRRKGQHAAGMMSPSKKKTSGALEAFFGIHKKAYGDESGAEMARWDSVHTVTIEVPNIEEGTCEYTIQSAVWCRYSPEDVGDVPLADRPKVVRPKSPPKKKVATPTKMSKEGHKLELKRLEVFDRAANHWDSKKPGIHMGRGESAPLPTPSLPKGTPIPATVTSAAIYTKETSRVCKLSLNKKQPTSIPVASHIQNIGSLLEKIETDFRSKLERVDAPKCVEVLEGMYRQSLSPGLKLPNRAKSFNPNLLSRRGGHATGMGVGQCMIAEMALKAKAKGLGKEDGSSKNKAMEAVLEAEKKKLVDNEATTNNNVPDNWSKAGLKKSKISPEKEKPTTQPGATGFLKRASLRKAPSIRTFSSGDSDNASSPSKPEFMNFRSRLSSSRSSASKASNDDQKTTETSSSSPEKKSGASIFKRPNLRKAGSARKFEKSNTSTPTPEFMNFRSKLKSTKA